MTRMGRNFRAKKGGLTVWPLQLALLYNIVYVPWAIGVRHVDRAPPEPYTVGEQDGEARIERQWGS